MEDNITETQLSDYLTVRQAASMLGVSSSTLRNWDRSGKLMAIRHPFNGYRLYLRTELLGILQDVARGANKNAKNSS